MLFLLAAASSAALLSESYGDWNVRSFKNGMTIAGTTNDGGAIFGTLCTKGECSAFFNPKIKCDDGEDYPALINAPSAAFSVALKCEKIDDEFFYSLPVEGLVADAMSVGGVLGIAFPMQTGQFQVGRFSMTGAARATARAAQVANAQNRPVRKSTSSDNFDL